MTPNEINDLEDDLLTVLEMHMDEQASPQIFFHMFRFMTKVLYEFEANDDNCSNTLRKAIDAGIKDYFKNN